METPAPIRIPATRPGFFPRLFNWRTMRKVLFVLASLITLAALLLAEEDWRGARAFANYKRAMEAKGEHFDAARLIPPKVPDDQNFAMTPYFAPSFDLPAEVLRQPTHFVDTVKGQNMVERKDDKRATNSLAQFQLPDADRPPNRFAWHYGLAGDLIPWAVAFQGTNSAARPAEISGPVQAASIVLDSLKICEPALAELQSAGARPFCRFNIPYEKWPDTNVVSALLEHLAGIKHLYQILTLHAEAEMVLGRTDQALKNLNVLFRVDDGLKDEPLLISQLVRIAGVTIMLGAVGEGLAEHRWSDDQLQVLQARLQKTDLLASTVQALRGERDICYNPHFDQGGRCSTIFPFIRAPGVVSNSSMSIARSRSSFSSALTSRRTRSIQASIIRLTWLSRNTTTHQVSASSSITASSPHC